MSSAKVERVGPDDWERARDIRLRALRDTPDAFWTTLEEELASTAEEWKQRLGRDDAVTFIACRDGEDVGLAVGAPHHEHDGDAGLYAVWVAPEGRGGGVGGALIEAVIGWARGAGYRRLLLDVGDWNEPAIRLYERLGFEPTGVSSSFPAPREHLVEHERALEL